jgi:hypothetical protein
MNGKLYGLQSRNQLHVVIFGCSQKVKLFCGSFGVQSTSLVGLNEIRSIAGTVVSPKYSTWKFALFPHQLDVPENEILPLN